METHLEPTSRTSANFVQKEGVNRGLCLGITALIVSMVVGLALLILGATHTFGHTRAAIGLPVVFGGALFGTASFIILALINARNLGP